MIGLRLVFLLILMAVGFSLASEERFATEVLAGHRDLIVIMFTAVGLIVIALDIFIPRKSLAAISGVFFGLVVGMVISYGLSLVVDLLVAANVTGGDLTDPGTASLVSALKLALGVVCCYFAVSFVLPNQGRRTLCYPLRGVRQRNKGCQGRWSWTRR